MKVVDSTKVAQLFQTRNSGWKSEAEFTDFIETNIILVAEEIIHRPYEEHKREWFLQEYKGFGSNAPRTDLVILTADGKRHGIECKFQKGSFSDLSRCMSQLLSYAAIAECQGYPLDTLWLFTTHYHDVLRLVIEKYKLPIRVVVFSRTQRAELINA
jgi:hypothetical protein